MHSKTGILQGERLMVVLDIAGIALPRAFASAPFLPDSPKRSPSSPLFRNSKYTTAPFRPFIYGRCVLIAKSLVAKINVVECAVKKWPRDTAGRLNEEER